MIALRHWLLSQPHYQVCDFPVKWERYKMELDSNSTLKDTSCREIQVDERISLDLGVGLGLGLARHKFFANTQAYVGQVHLPSVETDKHMYLWALN
jgi:hypothetical protein